MRDKLDAPLCRPLVTQRIGLGAPIPAPVDNTAAVCTLRLLAARLDFLPVQPVNLIRAAAVARLITPRPEFGAGLGVGS